MIDPFGIRTELSESSGTLEYPSLPRLGDKLGADIATLPHTIKILLENIVRRAGTRDVAEEDVESLAAWPDGGAEASLAFMPARVLMQDFTGVPAVVDLAALRSAVERAGGDHKRVNPFVPVDLIIDHSVTVEGYGNRNAYAVNLDWEYRRNQERYALLRWAQQAFNGFRVVPPGMGICHQVNLEYLGQVVIARDGIAFPDTLVGTDSHTTMINGLGILGWGVGGIEAEAAMLGQPMFLTTPVVVGIRTLNELPPGTTATDLVLTLTEMLRAHGVVGKFVEFFGAGLSSLSIADRATLSNMSPEFGATATLFPTDSNTLEYLGLTSRAQLIPLVERYTKDQGMFRTDQDPEPRFSEVLELDLGTVEPSVAGPKRPQDRVPVGSIWSSFTAAFEGAVPDVTKKEVGRFLSEGGASAEEDAHTSDMPFVSREVVDSLTNGSVVIAAITSCTNTSNPSVMVAAGLLAKKAVELGLETKPWVKTSLAPGSRVVTEYLEQAGLTTYLEKLRFNLVGYGCTTCIGNSGPLHPDIAEAVETQNLTVAAVLSGNRNFEARIHPQVKASYLASPPLCVAFALAGRVDIDITSEPLATAPDGTDVYLKDIWPSTSEVESVIAQAIGPDQFEREYGRIFDGDENWKRMPAPTGSLYEWDSASTYVQEPPYFMETSTRVPDPSSIEGARVLVMVGDSITTDHISPAGSIKLHSPAGEFLTSRGVEPQDFNSFGSRRGNHEVMLRGTFGNIRLRNSLAPGTEGPWTIHFPSGEKISIYEASLKYLQARTPLLVIAGKEYGTGSSRDWAAKGTSLLGVRAVIAESYERIHRSNLVGMGVLPLQFLPGQSALTLGLDGTETFSVSIEGDLRPGMDAEVEASGDKGPIKFGVKVRIDAPAEAEYFRHGGVLQMVLRQLLSDGKGSKSDDSGS